MVHAYTYLSAKTVIDNPSNLAGKMSVGGGIGRQGPLCVLLYPAILLNAHDETKV